MSAPNAKIRCEWPKGCGRMGTVSWFLEDGGELSICEVHATYLIHRLEWTIEVRTDDDGSIYGVVIPAG